MIESTLKSLKTNKFIVTPNQRLASFLIKKLSAQLEPGEVLDIQVLSWVSAMAEFRLKTPLYFDKGLLSTWQSRLLWQGVIRASGAVDGVINVTDTVKLAALAADLCTQWRFDPKSAKGLKEETDVFIHWWETYLKRCDALHMMDEGMMAEALLKACEAGHIDCPSILLYGFDDFSPLQQAILNALHASGTLIQIEHGASFESRCGLWEAQDQLQEWKAAVTHAKRLLDADPNPTLPIGIVIPDLQTNWRSLNTILMQVFAPEYDLPGSKQGSLPYNISSGIALYEHPAIRTAMMMLELPHSTLPSKDVSYLLDSPYIRGGMSEHSQRALFDFKLRDMQLLEYPLDACMNHPMIPPLFKACLQSRVADSDESRTLSVWADTLMEHLNAWGWPGERTLDSVTYQAVEQFYELLTQMRSLDAVSAPMTYDKMIHQLSAQLKQTLFQPQSEDKPIQVLGMLEAAGLSFSHLWVCHMSSDVIPAAPRPNPFIPTSIQIKESMPHASAAREWQFAQKRVSRLVQSSPEVVFSYHKHGQTGFDNHPCVLLSEIPRIEHARFASIITQSYETRIQSTHALEDMPPEQGLPIQGDSLRGGASVLKAQIACPFKAYAVYRLHAKSLEEPTLGLNAKVRGQVLHAIMQGIWRVLQRSQTLLELSEQALTQFIQQQISLGLNEVKPPIDEAIKSLEAKRLFPLIWEALENDKQRPPFVIKALEQPVEARLGAMSLRLQIDRIDDTPDGDIIIDYKTGKISTRDWEGEYPDDPQLPLYAVLADSAPAGIAFSAIRKEEIGIKGMGSVHIEGMKAFTEDEWHDQISSWRSGLTSTVTAIAAGKATLSPRYGKQTCNTCECALICRVAELEANP